MIIREDMERLDDAQMVAAASDNEQDPDLDINVVDTPVEYVAHISVGSALKPVSVTDIEASHSDDSAFQSFRTKLTDSLQLILAEETDEYKPVRIHRDLQVRISESQPHSQSKH